MQGAATGFCPATSQAPISGPGRPHSHTVRFTTADADVMVALNPRQDDRFIRKHFTTYHLLYCTRYEKFLWRGNACPDLSPSPRLARLSHPTSARRDKAASTSLRLLPLSTY